MDLTFHRACLRDLPEVFALIQRATAHMLCLDIQQWDRFYPTKGVLRRDILKGQLYTGRIGGHIVSIYVLNQECDTQYQNCAWRYLYAPWYCVHRLCVDPSFQNCRIGLQTMKQVEHQAYACGGRSIRLDVFPHNPYAYRLYQTLGYEVVGIAHWRKGTFHLMEKKLTSIHDTKKPPCQQLYTAVGATKRSLERSSLL